MNGYELIKTELKGSDTFSSVDIGFSLAIMCDYAKTKTDRKKKYCLSLMKYVESNPVRAGIVKHSADWPWSSLAIRRGNDKLIALSDGPVKLPRRWRSLVDNIPDDRDCQRIEKCVKRGQPFGNSDWVMQTARRLCLESTLKPRGRPRKGV